MRIGLFTDTYLPSINGIVYVVESLKKHLMNAGHEVYVFCPARSIRPSKHAEALDEDDHVIRFPSVKSGFFDDFDLSLFFPPKVIAQINHLDLDIVHIFTPSQVGLIGIQAAYKYDIPFVVQHSTDLYEFAEHYPSVLPGALALASVILPMTVKLETNEIKEIAKLYRPRRGAAKWNKDIIEKGITMLYSKADAVIALSRKSQRQLESWQTEDMNYPVTLLPSGVDAIPLATPESITLFKSQHHIDDNDLVYGFVGRLGAEKNLEVLIDAFPLIAEHCPEARLVFVGDFDYRPQLEAMAQATGYGDRITVTGSIKRELLGAAYASFDVFTFPSLKDTQGWAIHEAAHAGLPIILIDQVVSEVVKNGENGLFAENNAASLADCVQQLFANVKLRQSYGRKSKKLAQGFSEKSQTKKVIALYQSCIASHIERTED